MKLWIVLRGSRGGEDDVESLGWRVDFDTRVAEALHRREDDTSQKEEGVQKLLLRAKSDAEKIETPADRCANFLRVGKAEARMGLDSRESFREAKSAAERISFSSPESFYALLNIARAELDARLDPFKSLEEAESVLPLIERDNPDFDPDSLARQQLENLKALVIEKRSRENEHKRMQ